MRFKLSDCFRSTVHVTSAKITHTAYVEQPDYQFVPVIFEWDADINGDFQFSFKMAVNMSPIITTRTNPVFEVVKAIRIPYNDLPLCQF